MNRNTSPNLIKSVIGFKDEAGFKDYLIASLVKENTSLKNKFSKQTDKSLKTVSTKLTKLSKTSTKLVPKSFERKYSLLGAAAITAAAAGGVGNHLVTLGMNTQSRKLRTLDYKMELAKSQLKVLLDTNDTHRTPHHADSISKLKYSVRKLNDQIRDLKTEGDVHKDKTYSLVIGGILAAKAIAGTVGAGGLAGAAYGVGTEALQRGKDSISRMRDRKRYRDVIYKSNKILKKEDATKAERNHATVSLRLAQASLNTKY